MVESYIKVEQYEESNSDLEKIEYETNEMSEDEAQLFSIDPATRVNEVDYNGLKLDCGLCHGVANEPVRCGHCD